MITPIHSPSLNPVAPALPQTPQPTDSDAIGSAFTSLLSDTLAAESQAQQLIETGLMGGDVTQAEVLASVKKAELSVRMLMQIRNKVIDALNEIQQMRF